MFIPIVVFAALVFGFYLYRKYYAQRVFIEEGISGPAPHWLIGNLAAFADESTRHLVLSSWTKLYGKVYVYFEGPRPVLVTSDPDMVLSISVKQYYSSFQARKPLPKPLNLLGSYLINRSMFGVSGHQWKRLRTIVSPAFTTTKLRSILPIMRKVQNDFMRLIDHRAQSGEAFNIYYCFKMMSLDIMSESAFGIELNAANEAIKTTESANPILEAINKQMNHLTRMPVSVSLVKLVTDVIELRKLAADKAKLKRQDILQLMMDQEILPEFGLPKEKGLTTEEIAGQSVLFFIGGSESPSNTLSLTCFLLAHNQRVQDKLLAEIDQTQLNGTADYDTVPSMQYLDCVINETLRLFPVALLVDRIATDDAIVNGLKIRAGQPVVFDVWSLHHNEEYWGPVDPEIFYPERFLDDYPTKQARPEAAFMPFGLGPRICIGMRLAQLIMKLTLVNTLQKYRIEKTERTGDSLKLKSAMTISPSEGIYVKLVKRV